jgi:hypothetical protein
VLVEPAIAVGRAAPPAAPPAFAVLQHIRLAGGAAQFSKTR